MDKLKLEKDINNLFITNEKMKDFNGFILIKEKDRIIFEKSFGMSNFLKNTVHNRDTIFTQASITKQFTAMCILILEQRKFLSIDDCITNYLPDYQKGKGIKIRNLLNHSSGIPDYWNQLEWIDDNYKNPMDTYNFIKSLEPIEKAGQSFNYCNSNYILLGILIEKVSGIGYEEFLKNNIFLPLNMTRTGCIPIQEHLKNIAIGYKTIYPVPVAANKLKDTFFSAGGMYSTAADLCKWDSALYTDQLISKERRSEMFTPSLGNYGFGWYIDGPIVQHGGDLPGFSTRITRIIDQNILILLLANVDGSPQSNMSHYADLVIGYI